MPLAPSVYGRGGLPCDALLWIKGQRSHSLLTPALKKRCILVRTVQRFFQLREAYPQMDSSVLGGANGNVPLLGGGWPGPSRELLFELEQRVILQASFFDSAPDVWWSSSWGKP